MRHSARVAQDFHRRGEVRESHFAVELREVRSLLQIKPCPRSGRPEERENDQDRKSTHGFAGGLRARSSNFADHAGHGRINACRRDLSSARPQRDIVLEKFRRGNLRPRVPSTRELRAEATNPNGKFRVIFPLSHNQV